MILKTLSKIPADKIKNIGFVDCKIKIEGQQCHPKEVSVQEEYEVKEERYTTFESADDCVWSFLEITTEKKQRNTENDWGCHLF